MLATVDRLAARQMSLVTVEQLRRLGVSESKRRSWIEQGVLVRIRTEVYRLAGAPIGWEQAVLAVALSAGEDFVISHTTAAAVWHMRFSDPQTAGIHLSGDRQVRIKGVTSHRTRVGPAERTVAGAIPVTTAERTIIDLAGTLSDKQLGQCVDDAMRRRIIKLERLRQDTQSAAQRGGRRRLEPVHKVLADRIAGYRPDESDFEAQMNRLWDELRLPPAKRQHTVKVDGRTYRLDRAIVEYKIGVEWNGYRYHNLHSDLDSDSNRTARLTKHGWHIIPVTAGTEPELIAGAVWEAYRDRGGSP